MARAYEWNDEEVSLIIGPTASGKTEADSRRAIRVARSQHPSPIDGIRKCRIVCIGKTYRDLWDKAIPSWLKVFSKDFGQWTGGKGDPATHIMDFNMVESRPGGVSVSVPMHIEMWFRAKSGDQTLDDFVKGLETTAFQLQEADQLDPAIIGLTSNRVGRYPSPDDRWDPEIVEARGWRPAFKGVYGSANRPVLDSWLDTMAYKEKAFGKGLFIQPPALLPDGTTNPKAENLHNLRKIDPLYYENLAAQMRKGPGGQYDVDRLLLCKAVHDRRGQPVYPQFDEGAHVARNIAIDPSAILIIAADTGNTLKNAAAFMQPRRGGGVNVLHEISPRNRQLTLKGFADEILAVRGQRFWMCQHVLLVVDPAAKAKMVDGMHGVDIAYWQFLTALTGLDTVPADTNDPGLRRSALGDCLDKTNAFFVDGEFCPDIVAALSGGYCFQRIGNSVSPNVMKNDHSHPAEAVEYGCLQLRGDVLYFGPTSQNGAGDEAGNHCAPVF